MSSSTMLGGAARRALILQRIAGAWDKRPDMRLGQLLIESAYGSIDPDRSIHAVEDMRFAEMVERYVLLRPKPFEEIEPITTECCAVCHSPESDHGSKLHRFVPPK